MSNLNKPICTVSQGNTGVPDCYFDIKKIKGILLMKKTKRFTSANMADDSTFEGVLQTSMTATGNARVYPIFEFQAFTDNSEDLVKATTGYGWEKMAREGMYKWLWEMGAGGMCLQSELRKFNTNGRKGWGFMLVDAQNQIFGTKDGTSLAPIDLSFFHAHAPKIADGSNETKYFIEINAPDKSQLIDNIAAYSFGTSYDIDDMLPGILPVELIEVSNSAGSPNEMKIKSLLNCGKTNLYDDFSTILGTVGAWTLTNATGGTVTISSAAVDAVNKAIDLEFTGAAGTYTLNLADAATLEAAGMGGAGTHGYEGISIDIVIT